MPSEKRTVPLTSLDTTAEVTAASSIANFCFERRCPEALPLPPASTRRYVARFSVERNGLAERRGADTERSFDDARLATEIAREALDHGLVFA